MLKICYKKKPGTGKGRKEMYFVKQDKLKQYMSSVENSEEERDEEINAREWILSLSAEEMINLYRSSLNTQIQLIPNDNENNEDFDESFPI